MKLNEIKEAVEQGKTVHWCNDLYTVIKDEKCNRFLITCCENYIGLTHKDGVTLNGKEEEFYIG